MPTMVLRKNNITFNGDHYLQINGTAMGTKMAPSYANIFMGKFEKQLLESSIERPLSSYRFIDDVDMKWIQSDEELQNFLSCANNLHPLSSSLMKYLTLPFPFSTFLALYRIYTPNLPTPINTFCLAAVILLM
jgi:hypothetical protein